MTRKLLLALALGALAPLSRMPAVETDAQYSLNPATMSEDEWKEFRFERNSVIRLDSKLSAESLRFDAAVRAQAKAVEVAMIKADPTVKPILTKLSADLHGDWKTATALSLEEWRKLRATRASALENNPDLVAANKKLIAEKRSFEADVNAALLKADPGLAAFLSKLKSREWSQ